MAVTYSNIAGAEPSTVTFRAATVQIVRGSTNEQQEIISLGDPQTSNAIVRVVAAPPVSTEFGLVVRIAGGPSSVADLAVRAVLSSTSADNPVAASQGGAWTVRANLSSTAADNPVTVAGYSTIVSVANKVNVGNSTAADLLATVSQGGAWTVRATLSSTAADNPVSVAGYSTIVSVANQVKVVNSTAADFQAVVQPLAGSTWSVRPVQSSQADLRMTAYQSTAADLQVTVAGYSTVVSVAAFPAGLLSSAAGSSNSSALLVRPIIDAILTTGSTNAFGASTSLSIQSSGAALRSHVVAYSILSTNAGPHKVKFYSSGTMLWPTIFAAVSSAVSGANLAVSAPAYLFRSNPGEALTLQLGGGASTIAGYQVGVSYFRAP